MSKESAPAGTDPIKDSIPVCTLFSDGSAQGDNAFQAKGGTNPSESVDEVDKDVTHEQVKRQPSEPALCNVFAEGSASSSGEDIFSKISAEASEVEINSEASENTLSTDVSSSAMETLRLNRSVDSFIVEDLAETDVIVENKQLVTQDANPDQEAKPEVANVNFPEPTAGPVETNAVSSSAMETLPLNRSVDSFIVEDLAETDVIVENEQLVTQDVNPDQEAKPEVANVNFPEPSVGPVEPNTVSTSAMETLRLNRSVDSFIVEDLAETDVIVENEQLVTQDANHDQEAKPEVLNVNFPKPTAGSIEPNATETANSKDTTSEELRKPVIASPSFVSVTSFSISPDVQSSMSTSNFMTDSTSVPISEMEGLSIEGVKTETFKYDLPLPAEPDSAVAEAIIKEQEQLQSCEESLSDSTEANKTTESLFSSSQDGQQNSFFLSDLEGQTVTQDDPFAAALSNSALDRRRDAWLPSEETRTILMACMVNQKAPDLEMEKFTRPGLSSSEILEDPVKDLVTQITGSDSVVKRENLTAHDVSQDKEGIQKLMDSGNHRSAANLCAKLLEAHGQGFGRATEMTTNTPETLWLWYIRIYILIKLKLFDMAVTELSAFGNLDNPDLYFEFYPDLYPGRRGSMVPFEFRLVHAEFQRHVEKPQESLNRLHKILSTCTKISNHLKNGKNEIGQDVVLNQSDVEASTRFWTERKVHVLFCIGNTLIQLKDYILAVEIYDQILEMLPENAVALQSGIGRLFLHIGDIRLAQQRFTSAEKDAGNDSQYQVQLLINRGFMYIGTNNWKEAFTQFESAANLEPHNLTALNNKAVCLLYLGQLKDSIAILENGAMQQSSGSKNINRKQAMLQGVLSNLSTLYELESSHSVVRKRSFFLKHIAPTSGDSFDTACFKGI